MPYAYSMNPLKAAQNRTARLAREAVTPVYTSETGVPNTALLAGIERDLCTEDYCFVCGRCTDHFGEHSDAQLLRAYKGA